MKPTERLPDAKSVDKSQPRSLLRRKIFIAAVAVTTILIIVAFYLLRTYNAVAEDFQKDADIIRLQHLKHYGDLIEEYHSKTGKYPFEGTAKVPLYVHIANDHQAQYAQNGPPTPHKLIKNADFIAELEKGLGRTIKERYDPSFAPKNKPNFYIYMTSGDFYFFAVHLHQPYSFAKKLADNYHKAEISSVANDINNACSPKLLFESTEFKAATQKPLTKPGFFAAREKQYESFTKTK
jgi:hypothetical protein